MVGDMTGPAAQGVRVEWAQVPGRGAGGELRTCAAPRSSAARTQPGGFSPGLAARVRCANGARYFVKAVSAQANPDTPGLHRQEARVLAALEPLITSRQLPVPRLHGIVDRPPWVALVLQDVAGRQPQLPWRTAELRQVVACARPAGRGPDPGPGARPGRRLSGSARSSPAGGRWPPPRAVTTSTLGHAPTWTSWRTWKQPGPITRPATRCCTRTSAPTTSCSPGRARWSWTGHGPAGERPSSTWSCSRPAPPLQGGPPARRPDPPGHALAARPARRP